MSAERGYRSFSAPIYPCTAAWDFENLDQTSLTGRPEKSAKAGRLRQLARRGRYPEKERSPRPIPPVAGISFQFALA